MMALEMDTMLKSSKKTEVQTIYRPSTARFECSAVIPPHHRGKVHIICCFEHCWGLRWLRHLCTSNLTLKNQRRSLKNQSQNILNWKGLGSQSCTGHSNSHTMQDIFQGRTLWQNAVFPFPMPTRFLHAHSLWRCCLCMVQAMLPPRWLQTPAPQHEFLSILVSCFGD